MSKCEVCKTELGPIVLDLGPHPLCDDLKPIGSQDKCKTYPIEIRFCTKCYTAHQEYQPPKVELFSPEYHYRSRMTGSVLAGMENLVKSCVEEIGSLHGKKVLDIGCNDGSLLNFFKEEGAITLGVDPTDAAQDSTHETLQAFFDKDSAEKILTKFGHPDVITFTNVFAHIENLPELLDNLKSIMKDETYLVIENHYLGAVLEYGQFDTFYHEHPRTYSAKSFHFIADSIDRKVVKYEFVSRYGGNIRAFITNATEGADICDESPLVEKVNLLQTHADRWREEQKDVIEKLVSQNGPLRAKAFPGRAAILIEMLELNDKHISAVYEIKGSIKVGHYVPNTRIPILPEKELYAAESTNAPILNLAWHLPAEVRANLQKNDYHNEVIDIKKFERI